MKMQPAQTEKSGVDCTPKMFGRDGTGGGYGNTGNYSDPTLSGRACCGKLVLGDRFPGVPFGLFGSLQAVGSVDGVVDLGV